MSLVFHLMVCGALLGMAAGCASPKGRGTSDKGRVMSDEGRVQAFGKSVAPAGHQVAWAASPETNVFYEVQHVPDLQNFTVFAYTAETNVGTDPGLAADYFRVRAVRNNGFHSSETSEWGHN